MKLLSTTYFWLFLIMVLGLALGKLKWKGISLDSAAVLLVAMVFGHFGVQLPEDFQKIGLVLFVFSVGIQSGPGFFDSFGKGGFRLVFPVLLIVSTSVALMLTLAALFHVNLHLALGLLTGGRSSNSALAVGVESSASTLPALGHSLAYPLGVLGTIFFVRLLPLFLKTSLKEEEAAEALAQTTEHPPLLTRTFRVSNPNVLGRNLDSLHFSRFTKVNLSRILHGGEIHLPSPHLVLDKDDLIKAVGPAEELRNVELLIGPEVDDNEARAFSELPQDVKHDAQWIFVSNKRVIRKTLGELGLWENFSATVTRVQRNGIELSPQPYTSLRYGDRVMVVTYRSRMDEVRHFVGDGQRSVDKDFIPIFLAILIGLLLGSLRLPFGSDFVFSLGTTGGVLLASLFLGRLGKTGDFLWHISDTSHRFVRQIGLLLFLSAVGTSAGHNILAVLSDNGLPLVVTALTISIVPLALCALFCRLVWKMNALTLLGVLSGGTTCSPALGVVNSMTSSNVPNVAYATVFPFALISMMICAQIIALFLN
jgi:putative transport protein